MAVPQTFIVLLLRLLLPLALLLLLFIWLKTRKNEVWPKHKQLPPGPPRLPLIGNLHQLDSSSPHRSLWKLSMKYGPLMYLQLGRIPTLVVSSARMAKEVLKTHDLKFASRPSLVGSQKLSYNCLDVVFSPYGDYWREMRKFCILELFNTKRTQSFQFMREDEVAQLVKAVSRLASSNEAINLSEMLLYLTNNIICRMAFGKGYQSGGWEEVGFKKVLNEAQALMGSFAIADHFPAMGWIEVLTGMRSRLESCFRELDAFYQQAIDDHLDPARPKPEKEDIVDVLIRMREDRLGEIDWDHIKGVLTDILVAGTDTSAATLVWAMTELVKNPTAMKKAQDEVRGLIGRKGKVKEEDLHQLHYLKSVVKETMRLHTPAPLLVPRQTIQQCKIMGYKIYPKTRVFVNAWAIGRDPESWVNPEEFLPERFTNSTIDIKGQHFELIPFGAGRRGCPAIYLGTVTVELALANLLYKFNWDLPYGIKKEEIDMDEAPGITVHKKNALCLMATNYDV